MENAQWALLLTYKKHIKLITFLTHTLHNKLTIMHWVGARILWILVEFTAPISHFPIPDSLNRTQESLIKAPSVRRTNFIQGRKKTPFSCWFSVLGEMNSMNFIKIEILSTLTVDVIGTVIVWLIFSFVYTIRPQFLKFTAACCKGTFKLNSPCWLPGSV